MQEWEEQQKKKQDKALAGWAEEEEGGGAAAGGDSDSDAEELPFACYRCFIPSIHARTHAQHAEGSRLSAQLTISNNNS